MVVCRLGDASSLVWPVRVEGLGSTKVGLDCEVRSRLEETARLGGVRLSSTEPDRIIADNVFGSDWVISRPSYCGMM